MKQLQEDLSQEEGSSAAFSPGTTASGPLPARSTLPACPGARHSRVKSYLSVQENYTLTTENRQKLKENNPNPVRQAKAITISFFSFLCIFSVCFLLDLSFVPKHQPGRVEGPWAWPCSEHPAGRVSLLPPAA